MPGKKILQGQEFEADASRLRTQCSQEIPTPNHTFTASIRPLHIFLQYLLLLPGGLQSSAHHGSASADTRSDQPEKIPKAQLLTWDLCKKPLASLSPSLFSFTPAPLNLILRTFTLLQLLLCLSISFYQSHLSANTLHERRLKAFKRKMLLTLA